MKTGKIIGWAVLAVVVIGLGWGGFTYWKDYVGDSYYTVVNRVGQQKEDIDDKGNNHGVNYVYDLKSYNKDGAEKTLHFQTINGRELRQGAYLKLKVSESKGVISFEEVQKKEVPDKALAQLK